MSDEDNYLYGKTGAAISRDREEEYRMSYQERDSGAGAVVGWSIGGILFLMLLVLAGMVGCPQYEVYSQRLTGEAELARAQQNRQIAVNEAQAKMDAAKLLAAAEVERAKGVAQANQIIAQGLKDNEAYLRYLWITEVASVGKEGKTVVYVPTEANMPILEAGRKP